jgi:hypothetical protein
MTLIEVVVVPDGMVKMIFDERYDLRVIGCARIARASHVEPTDGGQWTADLSPVGGPTLGPFDQRREALAAEVRWLQQNWLIRAVE